MKEKADKPRLDYVEKVGDIIIAVIAVLLILGGNMVVFSRITAISTPWTEELLRNCFVMLIFLGTAFESKRGLVSVSIIEESLRTKKKDKPLKVLKLFHTVVCLLFSGFCVDYYCRMMITQFRNNERSLILNYQTGIVTLLIVVGCVLWTAYQIQIVVRMIRDWNVPIAFQEESAAGSSPDEYKDSL